MNSNELHNAPRKLPFEVPDGYFDELEQRIQSRISEPRTSRWAYLKWVPVPAFMFILFITTWIIVKDSPERDAEAMIADIPSGELIVYLEGLELTDEEIASLSNAPDQILESASGLESLDLPAEDLEQLYDIYNLEETI